MHSILFAAALLIGSSSEVRKAHLFTVSLFDEKENRVMGQEAPVGDMKQIQRLMETAKSAEKRNRTLSSVQDSISIQTGTPSAAVKAATDTIIDPGPGVAGIEAKNSTSQVGGSSPSSAGSKTSGINNEKTDIASAVRGQAGRAAETGSDAALMKKIRDALQANLVYPYIARKRRIEGTVLMEFHINGRGMPEGIRVAKGSNYAVLDEAARETVLKTSPFPARDNIIEVPIRFSLTGE